MTFWGKAVDSWPQSLCTPVFCVVTYLLSLKLWKQRAQGLGLAVGSVSVEWTVCHRDSENQEWTLHIMVEMVWFIGNMLVAYKKLLIHMERIYFFSDLVSSFSNSLARNCTGSNCLAHITSYPVIMINHTIIFFAVQNRYDQSWVNISILMFKHFQSNWYLEILSFLHSLSVKVPLATGSRNIKLV